MQYTLAQVAEYLGAVLVGDGSQVITGIAPLDSAGHGEISFLDNTKYRKLLPNTQAAAVILTQKNASGCPVSHLVVSDPYYSYARAAQLFVREPTFPAGIHPTAIIDPSSQIDASAHIGPYVVIGANTVIAARVIIGAHCTIGDRSAVGEASRLWPNVNVYDDVIIGARARIHSGAVIGSDGFGLAKHQGQWYDIPQLGGVVLGDDVLVGANTAIDCGALNDTRIANGVKLDNLIQVGHNVQIGEHTAIAGCVAIAGSSRIGANCIIGGGTGIAGHLTIADNVALMGMTGVPASIDEPGAYASGFRAVAVKEWFKVVGHIEHLPAMAQRLKQLEKMVGVTTNPMESE